MDKELEELADAYTVALALTHMQGEYIDRLNLLASELWGGISYARGALNEMEAAIIDQGLKPLLSNVDIGQNLLYTGDNTKNRIGGIMKSVSTLKTLLAKRAALDKQIADVEKKLIAEAEAIEKAAAKADKKPATKKPAKPRVKKSV
jgi:hypothetical protein